MDTKLTSVTLTEGEKKKFRRDNKTIGVRVQSGGTLTLLSRKVLSAVLYHTQRLGAPGENSPKDDPVYKKYYWVSLDEFMTDICYDSRNIDHLKTSFANLMDIKLACDTDDSTGIENLISGYLIINATGRRGEQRWAGWALPPLVEDIALHPGSYTTTSLQYLSVLRSACSMSLYETARRYVGSPGGVTRKQPLAWWNEQLRGVPVGSALAPYKTFKRDVLNPAIRDVNELTDIFVELDEKKEGRQVVQLQFKVSAQQTVLDIPAAPVLDESVIARLMTFGFSREESHDFSRGNTVDHIVATIALVETRLANTKLPKIETPAAFFKSALRGRYIKTEKAVKVAKKAVKAPEIALLPSAVGHLDTTNNEVVTARAEALASYLAMTEEDKRLVIEQIATNSPSLAKQILKRPGGKSSLSMISIWMVDHKK